MSNIDPKTVAGFGCEWVRFDQSGASIQELERTWRDYFHLFPWDSLPTAAEGFDLGCGSGRWAKFVAPRVRKLHCIDASSEALNVARCNLAEFANCVFHHASVDEIPLGDGSMDFGYSLGVLHHLPDAVAGMRTCVAKLKPGAPFIVYLYYALDNRPTWFRILWRLSDAVRRVISNLPHFLRYRVAEIIAIVLYLPLARLARIAQSVGVNADLLPLAAYRERSFYTMRTDALDRFGTRLERRFTKHEIRKMMEDCGLERIEFSDRIFWGAIGYKRLNGAHKAT